MAVQQLIGFETGQISNEVAASSGTVAIGTTNAYSGTYALQTNPLTTGTGFVRVEMPSTTGGNSSFALASLFISFRIYVVTAPAASDEIICRVFTGTNSTTLKLEVRLNASRQIVVYDSAATLVATGTTVIALNTYTRIDIKSANGTTAAYEVRINEVSELSGTCNQGATNVGNFCLGKEINRNGNTVEYWFDDVYADSTAYVASGYRIVVDKPTANGATMSWTGGTNTTDYTQINAIPTQTANYVADPAATSLPVVATFAMQTYAQMGITAGSTILAIKSFTIARDGAVSQANSFQQGISSNAVDSLTLTTDTTTGSTDRSKLHAIDPNTSAAWTQSGLEAVLLKAVEGTTAVSTRLNAGLIMVAYVPAVATSVFSSTLSLMGVG